MLNSQSLPILCVAMFISLLVSSHEHHAHSEKIKKIKTNTYTIGLGK